MHNQKKQQIRHSIHRNESGWIVRTNQDGKITAEKQFGENGQKAVNHLADLQKKQTFAALPPNEQMAFTWWNGLNEDEKADYLQVARKYLGKDPSEVDAWNLFRAGKISLEVAK